jgi:hypothetical protein
VKERSLRGEKMKKGEEKRKEKGIFLTLQSKHPKSKLEHKDT